MKKTLILSILVAVMSGCSSIKNGSDSETLSLTGVVSPLGMTSFQYGTHSIKSENTLYALKSSVVTLDKFEDKAVTLKGKKVSGYPLEGGPELIEVTEISIK